MAERTLAVRRSILVTLLLAAGLLAAVLPTLLGEPSGEHPALRGLAAVLIAFLAALFLSALWGNRGPLAFKAHLLELAKIAAAVAALLLPALFAGMTTSEVEALATLAQVSIGMKKPVVAAAFALVLVFATYVVLRLKASVRERRLRGGGLVGVSAVVCVALFGTSVARLLVVPAPHGVELLTKTVLLLVLMILAVAAVLPGNQSGHRFDSRRLALALGFFGIGLGASYAAYRYLRPEVGEIERVLITRGDGSGTTFAAALDGRPDLYGVFSLRYASGTPELAQVRPVGPSLHDLLERVHRTLLGTATLVPRPEHPSNWSELRPPEVEASFVEVWIRFRWWPWTDLRPGLHIREPVYDWAVSPSATFAVATTYVRSRDAWPGSEMHPVDQGTYAVNLWRRGKQSALLVDDLPIPPQILELSERSVRLLIHGSSYSRGRMRMGTSSAALSRTFDRQEKKRESLREWVLATTLIPAPHYLATTTCDVVALHCEPWKTSTDSDPRFSDPADRIVQHRYGSWGVLDTRTLATVLQSPGHACLGNCDRAYLLRDGRVVRLLLMGRYPDWEVRISVFDLAGQETFETLLGNVRQAQFAGELDDGTVAILWRENFASSVLSLTEPAFGWTLDSWNPNTGERRRLADDIGTFPYSENDPSLIFVDRRGRLVAPAVDGLRELATLDSYLPPGKK